MYLCQQILIIKNRVRESLKHMILQMFIKEITGDSLTFNCFQNLRMRYCSVLFSEGKIVVRF